MEQRDATGYLPVELLHRILDFLPKAAILQFSHLSRRLRQIASSHSRCLIPVSVQYDVYTDKRPSSLSRAQEIVSHAVVHSMQLRVKLHGTHFLDDENEQSWHISAAVLADIWALLTRALPVCAWLDVNVPRVHHSNLFRVLRNPAPALRNLALHSPLYADVDDDGSWVLMPSDLFSQHAPRLSRVTLDYLSLGDVPIPVFRTVRRAVLNSPASRLDIGLHFPALRHLELNGHGLDELDCRRVALERLHISGPLHELLPVIAPQMRLSDIALVTYTDTAAGVKDEQVWSGLEDAALALVLGTRSNWSWIMSLRTLDAAHPPRQRAFLVPIRYWLMFKPAVPLAPRIVDVRVANTMLSLLLCPGLTLPALRRLQIDLVGEPRHIVWTIARFADNDTEDSDDAASAPCVVPCPQLLLLVLHATSGPVLISDDIPVHLGRSFGQLERAADQRACLELRGVQFGPEENQGTVREFFPSIVVYNFDPVWDQEMQDRLRL